MANTRIVGGIIYVQVEGMLLDVDSIISLVKRQQKIIEAMALNEIEFAG